MSQINIINQETESLPLSKSQILSFVSQLLKELKKSKKSISIVFVGDSKIASLNKQFRNIDGPTDVLSFSPNDKESEVFMSEYLGDIIISLNQVYNNSKSVDIDFEEEIYRCIVHGTLHLIGMDHKNALNEKEPMFRKQEKLLKNLYVYNRLRK